MIAYLADVVFVTAIVALWSLASLVVGILTGLLFAATPNGKTHFEDVAEWLTKIIAGLALMGLTKIPSYVLELSDAFAACFPEKRLKVGVCAALLVLFSIGGFLLGYALTYRERHDRGSDRPYSSRDRRRSRVSFPGKR